MSPLDIFMEQCKQLTRPRVLELGTKRSQAERSTKHNHFVPHAGEYVGTDIEQGLDVDLVADVHRLSDTLGREAYDVIISCSSFEHFKYPHLAAHQVMHTLRVGGLLYIQTHQTFPLHAYPYDYCRFSREAIAGLFGTQNGFEIIETAYQFPAHIHADEDPGAKDHPAYLNVSLVGRKHARTPLDYVYEL